MIGRSKNLEYSARAHVLVTTQPAPVTHTYRRHLPPPRGAQATTAQQGGTLVTSHKYHPSLHCSHEALLVCPSESTVQAPARAMENVPFNMSQHVFRGHRRFSLSKALSHCTDHGRMHHLAGIATSSAPQICTAPCARVTFSFARWVPKMV